MTPRVVRYIRFGVLCCLVAGCVGGASCWYTGRPQYAASRIASLLEQARWSDLYDFGMPTAEFESGLSRDQFARAMTHLASVAPAKRVEFERFVSTGRPTCQTTYLKADLEASPIIVRVFKGPDGWCVDLLELLHSYARATSPDPRERTKRFAIALLASGAEQFIDPMQQAFATRQDAQRLARGEVDLEHFWHHGQH